jgi:hypothetical protein
MNTYEARRAGREYCNTEGSEHYKGGEVEPLDLIFALGYGEGFCMGSAIKYASRYKNTRNLDDLKKVSDYAHILCGVELGQNDAEIATDNTPNVHKLAKQICILFDHNCEGCPIGSANNGKHIDCCDLTTQFPQEAIAIMRKAVE